MLETLLYTSENESRIDRVLTKSVSEHSHLRPVISKCLRSVMKAKLCRMGKALLKKNSTQRKIITDRWRQMERTITLTPLDVRSSLLKEKENLQRQLENERKTSAKLAKEVISCRQTNDSQVGSELQENSHMINGRKRQAQKSWNEYTPQYERSKAEEG